MCITIGGFASSPFISDASVSATHRIAVLTESNHDPDHLRLCFLCRGSKFLR